MNATLARLLELVAAGDPAVRVVVARVRGSAPREAGASMLVTREAAFGTIGGGHLELVATATARQVLAEPGRAPRVDRFSLGASLGQCCGGIVELAFLRYDASDAALLRAAEALAATDAGAVLASSLEPEAQPRDRLLAGAEASRAAGERELRESLAAITTPLWLFGAGHVGKALVGVLADLGFDITWVDRREAMFPATLPPLVHARIAIDPAEDARELPAGAWALVMTHSHDDDYAICEALLRQGAFGWLGLIGSQPKATRFRQRLARRGFDEAAIGRIVSPIGIGGIADKRPAAIAVAVAAQLLRLRESGQALSRPAARSA